MGNQSQSSETKSISSDYLREEETTNQDRAKRREDSLGEYKVFRLSKHRELLGDLEAMSTKHPILVLAEFDVALQVVHQFSPC